MLKKMVLFLVCSFLGLSSALTTAEEPEDIRFLPKRNYSDALKVGQEAPLFSLKALHGDEVFNLGDYRGKKPVVLFFGSYT